MARPRAVRVGRNVIVGGATRTLAQLLAAHNKSAFMVRKQSYVEIPAGYAKCPECFRVVKLRPNGALYSHCYCPASGHKIVNAA
jgi:hypothetical protein